MNSAHWVYSSGLGLLSQLGLGCIAPFLLTTAGMSAMAVAFRLMAAQTISAPPPIHRGLWPNMLGSCHSTGQPAQACIPGAPAGYITLVPPTPMLSQSPAWPSVPVGRSAGLGT